MPRRDAPLVGGLNLDPEIARQMRLGAATNQAALSGKQRREQDRISLRIDLQDEWLRDRLQEGAAREGVSVSHLARFLLAWAWSRYRAGDPELLNLIAENRYVYRSLRAGHGLDTDCLRDDVANPAEGSNGAL